MTLEYTASNVITRVGGAPMSLPKPVEALWSELERVRADVLREADGLSQRQADWRPGPNDWSVASRSMDCRLRCRVAFMVAMRSPIGLPATGHTTCGASAGPGGSG